MSTTPYYQPAKRIVVTGAPGSGKAAFLELARQTLCEHVEVLPNAARILFGGGFPHRPGLAAMRPAERAIFHLQSALESAALAKDELSAMICDRGTLDTLAYWPGRREDFFLETATTEYEEIQKYEAVIHFRLPESAPREARDIDNRLVEIWTSHPRRILLDDTRDLLANMGTALDIVRNAIDCPACRA